MRLVRIYFVVIMFCMCPTKAFAQDSTATTKHDTVIQLLPLDLRLLERLNHAAGPQDKKWLAVSNSLNITALSAPVVMEIIGFAANDNNFKNAGITTGASVILTSVVAYTLKNIFKRQRPYLAYPKLITGKSKETTYSFPSGHTSVAFATATAISLSFPKWYVITPAYTYALLVAYSRSYLGVHYPGDILAGAIIGAGTSILTYNLQRRLNIGFTIPIK